MRCRAVVLLLCWATQAAAERAPGIAAPRTVSGVVEPAPTVRILRAHGAAIERCFAAGFFSQDSAVTLELTVGVIGVPLQVRASDGPVNVGVCVGKVVAGLTLPRPRPARATPIVLRIGYRLTPGWQTRAVQGRLGEVAVLPAPGVVVAPDDRGPDVLASLPDELLRAIRNDAARVVGPGYGEPDDPDWRRWDILDSSGERLARAEASGGAGSAPDQWRLDGELNEITWSKPRGGRATERHEETFVKPDHESLVGTTTARWRHGRWQTVEQVSFEGGMMKTVRILPSGRRVVELTPEFIS